MFYKCYYNYDNQGQSALTTRVIIGIILVGIFTILNIAGFIWRYRRGVNVLEVANVTNASNSNIVGTSV
jgi:flagellar biosynthesis protein FliR